MFPVGALPVDLAAVGAFPEFVVIYVGVFFQFGLELLFGCGGEFGVADGAVRLIHVNL